MCGIAAFSIDPASDHPWSDLPALLVAALAERGEDACGVAWRERGSMPVVRKEALSPRHFLRAVDVRLPDTALEGLVHVRDHTKGRPTHAGNNHPIRHGRIVGVHNGIIQNDDELFDELHRERALDGMSVDSEAIFMALDVLGDVQSALDQLVGSYAFACMDDDETSGITVVRGSGRPLQLATAPGIALVASTHHAVQFLADHLDISLEMREIPSGTLLRLDGGEVASTCSVRVREFTEKPPLEYSSAHPNAAAAREFASRVARRLHPGESSEAQTA